VAPPAPVVQVDPPHVDPPPHASGGEDYSGAAGDTRHVRHMAYRSSYSHNRPGYLARAEALARAGRRLEYQPGVQDTRFTEAGPPPSDPSQAPPADVGSNH
jgi:hypothetical protein